jgi:hypothetical protein
VAQPGRPDGGAGAAATTVWAESEVVTVQGNRWMAAWPLRLVLTVSALACTSSQAIPTADRGTLATEACFNRRTVDSFSPLAKQFVYVRTLSDEHYLLTLDAIYVTLPYATGIAIANNYGRICSNTGARLTFVNAGVSVSCRIVRVEAVDSKEVAEQVVQDRTTPESR